MRTHVSAVLPKAFVSRIAILALMPDLPFTILVRVCRVTPRIFAPSVTDIPKGARQALLTTRPGWAGFFMGMAFLPFPSGSRSVQHQKRLFLQNEKRCASW